MSEKLKLSNGQEFDLIPMGIVTDDAKKVRYFKFITTLAHDEVLAIFSDTTNLATIDYIGEDGITAKTYQDCVKMLMLSFVPSYKVDDNTTADIYIATVNIDAVAMALKTAGEERSTIADALDFTLLNLMPIM